MALSVAISFKLLFFLIIYILAIHLVASRVCVTQRSAHPLKPPQCGYVVRALTARVVGGSPAEVGAWPWIANVGYEEDTIGVDFRCAGSLISSRHVITAGHCIYGFDNPLFIRLGEVDFSTDDEADPIDIMVEKVTIHPNFNNATYENDIAIMKLAKEVKFTDAIHPICLPVEDEIKNRDFVGHFLFVAGWGSTSTDGPFSNELLETQIPVVDRETCAKAYRSYKSAIIDDRIICAGYMEGGKDSCEGDSGGPLIYPHDQTYYLIGIVSGGSERCADPGVPGMYTRVTSFLDFILRNID